MMNRRNLGRMAATLAVACSMVPWSAMAADEAPDALIKRLSTEVISMVRDDKAIQAGDINKVITLVDKVIMPNVNFRRMTAAAVGPGWRKASPEQQKRLQDEFKILLVRTYAWILLLRNGGLVFPLAACVIAAAFCAWDAHVARRAAKQAGAAPSGAIPRFRWVGVLAVLALCLASNMYFTKVFMPAHDITPGSKREILSIPFQQTARFVQKHDGLNSGVNPTVKEDGTIVEAPCDGLVTDEERAVIDRVLKYENLGRRYNPDKSDAVKNCFNEYASQEDIKAYFEVWAQMFKKDPECYISALINNYYGYFYPSARDAWVYSTARSAEIMAKPDNLKYFDFHPVDSKVVRWCDHLINLYRVAVQRIPFISLTMSSATYVWIMIAVVVYLLRRHSWRALAIWVPLLGVLAVCLIGPCNGSTYMRYLYPVIACMPFAIGATVTRSDFLWS